MSARSYSINERKDILFPIAERYGVARIFLVLNVRESSTQADLDFRAGKGWLCGLLQIDGMYSDIEE